MPAHVTTPVVVHPPHWVATDDILTNIQQHHPDHPRIGSALRVIRNTGVQHRAFCHPLDSEQVSGKTGLVARNTQAWEDATTLAEDAAKQALDAASLRPEDIGGIFTSHSTSWAAPHLEVHLINALGLPPTVRRLAHTTLGCAGGAIALAKAADLVTARPGIRVLVVAAEVISTIYHHSDTSIDAMIYKGLFGDSGGACIVSADPLQPNSVRIDDSWEYVLPGSRDSAYWGRLDEAGFHFDSDRSATDAPARVMPRLADWLKERRNTTPDWAVVHAGGPAILAAVQAGLGLAAGQLEHSYASLAGVGNLGGVSVLDVMRRTLDRPPAPDSRGIAVAFGPGFATVALDLTMGT